MIRCYGPKGRGFESSNARFGKNAGSLCFQCPLYKRDCKNFASYCRANGVKMPEQLEKRKTEILQKYEDSLENAGYKPATIHRYLSAPCKALGVNMRQIEKPHRTADMIARGRDTGFNIQGQREITQDRFKRLVCFQGAVGLRRAELAKLRGRDFRTDESGYLCVYVMVKAVKIRCREFYRQM